MAETLIILMLTYNFKWEIGFRELFEVAKISKTDTEERRERSNIVKNELFENQNKPKAQVLVWSLK